MISIAESGVEPEPPAKETGKLPLLHPASLLLKTLGMAAKPLEWPQNLWNGSKGPSAFQKVRTNCKKRKEVK